MIQAKAWERSEESSRGSVHCHSDYIYCHEQNAARNMIVRHDSGKSSTRKEEDGIGHRRKGIPCYKVAEILAELCSSVRWEAEPT